MIRNSASIVRSLAAIAILAATVGCPADDAKRPSAQLQSPTGPFAGIAITMGSSRPRLEVGDDTKTSRINVEALRTANWTSVPNGTEAVFTATLGAIDGPTGARTATINLFDGKGAITLFPGTTSGTARVTVEILGVLATVNVAIDPDPTGGEPPVPAPSASTLSLTASPSVISEEDAVDEGAGPTSVMITATVLGTGGDPFKGGGIFFTTPLGTFSNGDATSDIFKTNSSGQVIEFLSIEDEDLLGFPGSSFAVTAHLGIEGGEKTATVTISIVAGPAPSVATTVDLFVLPDATVDDDGGGDGATLRAIVRDQFDVVMSGVTVFFTTQLGTLSDGGDDVTDGSGVAEVTLTLTAGELATFGPNTFTTSANILVDSDTEVITIARTPAPGLSASFTVDDSTPCSDDATDSTVQFTDTSTGAILTWEWDLDGDGFTDDSNVADPVFDYFGFTIGTPINVTLIVSDGGASDSFSMSITPADCI
jgi:hypothetical protein